MEAIKIENTHKQWFCKESVKKSTKSHRFSTKTRTFEFSHVMQISCHAIIPIIQTDQEKELWEDVRNLTVSIGNTTNDKQVLYVTIEKIRLLSSFTHKHQQRPEKNTFILLLHACIAVLFGWLTLWPLSKRHGNHALLIALEKVWSA